MNESVARESSNQSPPILSGFCYTRSEAITARNQNRLLSLHVETNSSCNLQCSYCCFGCGPGSGEETDFSLLQRLVLQAQELGAQSIVISGGGEPLLYSRFRDLVSFINTMGMQPVIFSNAVMITPEVATFLHQQNASVMAKLDSFHPATQDYLAGTPGAYVAIQAGLHNLLEAGFSEIDDPLRLRLGISLVLNKINIEEIDDLWHFCRRHSIYPYLEIMAPTGRARELPVTSYLTYDEICRSKLHLRSIDRDHYGYCPVPSSPMHFSRCVQFLYSLYVTITGDVRPGSTIKIDASPFFFRGDAYLYNAFRHPLREIYFAEPFCFLRFSDLINERCAQGGTYGEPCMGCRGYSYNVCANRGMNPYDALGGGLETCFGEVANT